MKTGIIVAAYNCKEYLENLRPFRRNDFKISVIHTVFTGNDMPATSPDGTLEELYTMKEAGLIDYLVVSKSPLTEVEARNLALQEIVLRDKIDFIWILDPDEKFEEKEIKNIINYIESKNDISVFNITFKNLTFDKNHYLMNFAPKRIFRTNVFNGKSIELVGFRGDNDIIFEDLAKNKILDDSLPSIKIPMHYAFPLHFSWCDLERCKQKINYQNSRTGWQCSFKIGDSGLLEFDLNYFQKYNLPLPEVFEE